MSCLSALTRRSFLAILLIGLNATAGRAQTPAVDLTGKWAFEVVTQNGTGTPTVTLTQTGDKLTGTYSSSRGVRQIEGTVSGDKVAFTAKAPDPAGVHLDFTGTIAKDGTMSGTADFSGQGSATFTARRAPATP